MAKQIGSKETVASIIDDNLDYYDFLIETKSEKKEKVITDIKSNDPKVLKENEMMKKRNEQLMQIMLEFENENKLLQKGLSEIHEQLSEINNKNDKSTKKTKNLNKFKDTILKCPSLDKLLIVNIFILIH
jgi:hypothetical protein